MDRRNFINKIGRGSILVGLVSIAGFSVAKLLTGDSTACPVNSFCSECKKKDKCSLPQKVNEEGNERR